MILHDLVVDGTIRHDSRITLLVRNEKIEGRWCDDRILAYWTSEIRSVYWDDKAGWVIAMKGR